jgi:ribosomal protein S18 acetylase RimI-like enzyme
MLAPEVERGLDNPMWTCLATRHAHLALGGPLARRYPSWISPIGGLPVTGPQNIAALEALVEPGDDWATAARQVPKLSGGWEIVHRSQLTQMIRTERSQLPEGETSARKLEASDVPEMLALVKLTAPGPFRQRTIELGRYIGIRENGKLVAMAGERMWIGDCREVSAVCTHPDAQGRGYARTLASRVINAILRAGETPFLHVESANARAIALYRSLGFVKRTEFPLLAVKRTG